MNLIQQGKRLDVEAYRFSGESALYSELIEDANIRRTIDQRKTLRGRESLRTRLLGSAVRVDPKVVPALSEAFVSLAKALPNVGEAEFYIYNDPTMNAFVTEGRTRTLVALSSAAANALDAAELRFVIGHELGHSLFDHIDIDAQGLAEGGTLSPSGCMRLRAWQRAAEISADRIGVLCCGSIEKAASSLFKIVSGLTLVDLVVHPEEFAGQWQHLLEEVVCDGDRNHWEFSHPFPPLRMAAMVLDSEARRQDASIDARSDSDAQILNMLATMDPGSGSKTLGDPMLGGFFFWGGLYVALVDGSADETEVERLQSVAPVGLDVRRVIADPDFDDAQCVERFEEGLLGRRKKLSAVERHRIIYGLIDIAAADGRIEVRELERLRELGEIMGIPAMGCELIVTQYKKECGHVD